MHARLTRTWIGDRAKIGGRPTTWIIFRVAAAKADRESNDVNQSLFEPFLNYNLPKGWYLIADPIITANWGAKKSSDRWTLPIGGGVGKLFKIGKQPINTRVEAYYIVEKPDNGPDW